MATRWGYTIGIILLMMSHLVMGQKNIGVVASSVPARYYVSNDGNDADNGLSPATAWKTILKVNGETFDPGDQILFNRGDKWVERLVVSSSGDMAAPITFSAYGTGDKPILSGSKTLTSWTGGPVYEATVTETTVWMAEENNIPMLKASDETCADGNWFFDNGIDKFYYKPLSGVPGDHVVTYIPLLNAIRIRGYSYITISNIEFQDFYDGVSMSQLVGTNTNSINITDCDFRRGVIAIKGTFYVGTEQEGGIIDGNYFYRCENAISLYVDPLSSAYSMTGWTITDNEMDECGTYDGVNHRLSKASGTKDYEAIGLQNFSNGIISGNYIHDGYVKGIFFYGQGNDAVLANNIVTKNIVINNRSTGFIAIGDWRSGWGWKDNLVSYNQFIYCGDTETAGHGSVDTFAIAFQQEEGGAGGVNQFVNNTIISSSADAIGFPYGAIPEQYLVIRNNIITGYSRAAWHMVNAKTELEIDHNIYDTDGMFYFNYNWRTLDYLVANTTYGDNSLTGDPLFISPTDFGLQAGSPAIDAGIDVGLDYHGTAPDMGAFESDYDQTDPPEVDSEPPSIPSGIIAIDSTQNSITITWESATDNINVYGYKIHVNDFIYGSTGINTYVIKSLIPSTKYYLAVSAFDEELNESPKSKAIVSYTKKKDSQPPTVPTGLKVDRATSNSLEVSWNASVDDYGIERYDIYLDKELRYTSDQTSKTISGLQANSTYGISVRACDPSNNCSSRSEEILGTTKPPDLEAPTTPTGLKESDVTQTTLSLDWDPSVDNVEVRHYRIYVNNMLWKSSPQTNAIIEGLQSGILYTIEVSAIDPSGNESLKSPSINVTTINSDFTANPTLPHVAIIQVQDKTTIPKSVSELNHLGFVELRSFGIEITERADLGKESIILKGSQTKVVNSNRITEGLKVLYNFAEGKGNKVQDISGVEPYLDLKISKEGFATDWIECQGLRINDTTIITNKEQSKDLIEALAASNEFSFEIWIKQENIKQLGLASIMTLSNDSSTQSFTITHESKENYYNYFSTHIDLNEGQNITSELRTVHNFSSENLHHIVYTRNNSGIERLYVNGFELAIGISKEDSLLWKDDFQLAFANDRSGEKPWKGIIYLAAIYNKALNGAEINQNYQAGFGKVQFELEMDTLKTNIRYELKPFALTDQGIVYGHAKDIFIRNQADEENPLSFYPNPSNGDLSVNIRNLAESYKECYLQIVDLSGKLHFTMKIDLSEGLLEKKIELHLPNTIPDGIYSMVLITSTSSAARRLIIIR